MKYISIPFFLLYFNCSLAQEINIIPQPVSLKIGKGNFIITTQAVIAYDDFTKNAASFLHDYLNKNYGLYLQLTMHNRDNPKAILLMSGGEQEKKGFYQLVCNSNGISIAGGVEGVFSGIQTLIQLLPTSNIKLQTSNIKLSIPQLSITDYPRFPYRGMHLDVARHFFPVSFIKKYIDYLALHKLNYFHWHLTDDQGWRIEIKKYPKLTSVGGWRNGTIIGRYPGTGNDSLLYGGFYTQEQIKEVVAYAKERYITVIPEIEMPGHASAAIASYPELSCFPGKQTGYPKECAWSGPTAGKQVQQTWGVFDDVFCAGKENTFIFLQDVMDEVLQLFPSKYIHVGGDESPKTHWKICPACQQRMKDNNLKDEHELQSYFIQRMEKYLNKQGRTLIGWDEILEGGLAPNAVVMSWQGEKGGIEAAKQNHNVIMTPGSPMYFDHTQSDNEDSVTFGGYNTIEKVYAYDPVPKELNNEQSKYILGAQANVWTEYMKNTSKVEYMIFPRMAALSEILWSPKEKRNWSDFEKRLQIQFNRYDLWKMNYSKEYFNLKTSVLRGEANNSIIWKLQSKYSRDKCEYCHIQTSEEFIYKKDTVLYDTTINYDEKDISKVTSYIVTKIEKKAGEKGFRSGVPWLYDTLVLLRIDQTTSVKAWQRFHHTKGPAITQNFSFNKGTAKNITLVKPPSDKYPGDGAFTLVNGVINEKGFARSKEFIGFSGSDCEAIIDLDSLQPISFIVVNALNRPTSWIYRPQSAEVFGSGDGKKWYPLKTTTDFIESKNGTGKGMMILAFRATYAQFVKVIIKNWGTIPEGNAGAGNKAWLFVDEIEVE